MVLFGKGSVKLFDVRVIGMGVYTDVTGRGCWWLVLCLGVPLRSIGVVRIPGRGVGLVRRGGSLGQLTNS